MTTTRKPNNRSVAPRNIYIANRKTSVRLERVMWDALAEIANAEGKTLFELINEIHRDHAGANLSSAITRLYRGPLSGGAGEFPTPVTSAKEKPRRSRVRFPMEIPCLSQGLGVCLGGACHPETAEALLQKRRTKVNLSRSHAPANAWPEDTVSFRQEEIAARLSATNVARAGVPWHRNNRQSPTVA
jgi:predicted DNA-binding ribbon-helix-helix protein